MAFMKLKGKETEKLKTYLTSHQKPPVDAGGF